MSRATVDERVARVAQLSAADLPAEWQAVFGEPAPALPTSLLRRALAYRVQEQAARGLPAPVVRLLDAIGRDSSTRPPDPAVRVKPGTRLLREWQGRVHTVLVADDGVLLDGVRLRSLSEAARRITGARWSGPRFFGLEAKAAPPLRGARRG